MDSARRAPATGPAAEALEFVRFCYRRRRLGWPELYDEMCTVAGRGLFRGWGSDELAAVGIGLSLFEMPGLAAMAARVVAEETAAERAQRSGSRGTTEAATPAGGASRADLVEQRESEPLSEGAPRPSMILAPGAA